MHHNLQNQLQQLQALNRKPNQVEGKINNYNCRTQNQSQSR